MHSIRHRAEEAAAFDEAMADLVEPYADDGAVELTVVADLAWGPIAKQGGT